MSNPFPFAFAAPTAFAGSLSSAPASPLQKEGASFLALVDSRTLRYHQNLGSHLDRHPGAFTIFSFSPGPDFPFSTGVTQAEV